MEYDVVQANERGLANRFKDIVENHMPKTCLKSENQVKSTAKVERKPGRIAIENTNVKLTKKRIGNTWM
ncbi:MAG: hypothetical protein JNN28_05640, partial [Saprospiraceae bacterium]|nr:hypothetical protein [Saprospiraceae bacterium]